MWGEIEIILIVPGWGNDGQLPSPQIEFSARIVSWTTRELESQSLGEVPAL